MAKKLVKKRKLRVFRLLILIVILGVLAFGVYLFLNQKTKNIIIKGTNYLNDDYVLELAGLKDYPAYYLTGRSAITNKLLKSPYIKKVTISRSFYHVITLKIDENKPLFLNKTTDKVVFENSKMVANSDAITIFRVPRLMNYVPDKKYKAFISDMALIKSDILGKIADIEYVPNTYDKDRFLLYMDDGNMVYLTLTKFKMLNYYNDVLKQLEDKKGILYLDSGNHFQIKE
jgi:cell division septal protein FtsQ